MTPSDDPGVVGLGKLRERLLAAHSYGKPGGLFDPSEAIRVYRLGITRCQIDRGTLVDARADLMDRLQRGMALPESPRVVEQFTTLLARLEGCEDALNVPAATLRLAALEMSIAARQVEAQR